MKKKDKILKGLKNYKIVISVVLIILITCEMVGYGYVESIPRIILADDLADAGRMQNIDFLENPLEIVEYSLDALTQKDLDKFIRGCAVQEQAYGMEYKEVLENQQGYSYKYSPSGNWLYYFPLMQAVLVQEASEMYHVLSEMFTDAKVLSVDYADLKYQLSDEYIYEMFERCEMWRASGLCEAVVLYEDKDGEYRQKVFLLINYNGQWKLKVDKMSAETVPDKISAEEYKNKIVANSDIEQYENRYQISEKKEVLSDALLPCNYLLYKARGEENPEKLIEEFIYTLKKGKFEETFTYLYNSEEIENKGENAKYITRIVYALLDAYPDQLLQSQYILNQMNPENMIYLRGTIEERYSSDSDSMEIVLALQLNGNRKHMGMTLKNTEYGWMIQSFKSKYYGYECGEMK